MKYRIFTAGLAALLAVSCTVTELDKTDRTVNEYDVYHASIEDSSTRVYVDDQLRVLWNADDRVSIFNRTTYNRQYRFDGEDGDNAGTFSRIPSDDFVTSNPLNYIYSVYPYSENTKITNDGELIVNLPAGQSYRAGTFGLGANTMIAIADDNELMFKNLCGYLMLRLYGDDVMVKSITLKGNDNEPLAGKATVVATMEDVPALTFDATATKEITLTFDTPVLLGSTAETATPFWLVVPPTVFKEGITVTVETSDGCQFEKSTTGSLTISRNTRSRMAALKVVPEFVGRYLKFTSEGTTKLSMKNFSNYPELYYSTDKANWTIWDYGDYALTITRDRPVYIRGNNPGGFSKNNGRYSRFSSTGDGFSVSGDIMSLIDYEHELTAIPSIYCFRSLFEGCTGLVSVPELPATTLTEGCYSRMFYGCTRLTKAPDLPATALAKNCYSYMFSGCSGLTEAPALPATELAEYCYQNMFSDCAALTETPDLPATTLAKYCYAYMFSGCTGLTKVSDLLATELQERCYDHMFSNCRDLKTAPDILATSMANYSCSYMFSGCTFLKDAPSLRATTLAQSCYEHMFEKCRNMTTAPNLPATTLAPNCYDSMFSNCTSLTEAPDLPATTLAPYCYNQLFSNCTSLTEAPDLPATTLASNCYYMMFFGCASLPKAPALPATTLASRCYSSMFSNCTSLTKAPDLPAKVLAEGCYNGMFSGCSKLSYVKCLATDISAESCVYYWLGEVAPTGTFVLSAGMKSWPAGPDGIPIGWTIYDENGAPGIVSNRYLTFTSEGTTTLSFSVNTPIFFYSTDHTNWVPWNYDELTITRDQPLYLCGYNPDGFNPGGYDPGEYYSSHFVVTGDLFSVSGDIMSLIDFEHVLTSIPSSASYCFQSLFADCTGLLGAPDLPATTLTEGCYAYMFKDCYNLTKAPDLPATTLAPVCYQSMFRDCRSLTEAPDLLPATTLAEGCYESMFHDCWSLTEAPELPATELAANCYRCMFYRCSDLIEVPDLPAMTLAYGCYNEMFGACTSLTTAPELPAATLVSDCYCGMFYGCYNLNYVKCLATDISANSCVSNWLYNVSWGGTFVKAAGMSDWNRGSSGIPDGWEIQGYMANPPSKYLTFTSEGTTTIWLSNNNDNLPDLYYSFDKTEWLFWDHSDLTFTSSQPVYLCGANPDGFSKPNSWGDACWSTFNAAGDNFSVSGDIMSLISYEHDVTSIPSKYCFHSLFYGCAGLVSAPFLPATTLTEECYSNMFSCCSSLTTAPALPATTLAPSCYKSMFVDCTSLTTAPVLPATTLTEGCYSNMFQGCTSLTTAPFLPATTLDSYCYHNMFCYCSQLNYVKCLATDISADECVADWLFDVSPTGTFVKAAEMEDWPDGDSGIPEGWTVQNAD